MSTTVAYPHLSIDLDGKVRIGTTRYKVAHLAAEHYCYGWSAEELLRQHPDLRPEQVYSALTYFCDHYDQLVAEMHVTAGLAAEKREAQRLTRDELLARRATLAGTQ
jgi:uncharacterized protein (DUF433 family)